MGLNALYVQLTRHREGTQIVLTEDQIDKMAQNAGIELAPTDRMIDFVERVMSEKPDLELPEDWNKDFDVCREWLDKYSGVRLGAREGHGLDGGLEKVKTLLASIRKTEKMNALDFEVLDQKGKTVEERSVGIGEKYRKKQEKEARSIEAPSPKRDHGKEESRPAEREREREYEPEREMGF
jgi:hypothetical protein